MAQMVPGFEAQMVPGFDLNQCFDKSQAHYFCITAPIPWACYR
jgi:hypothetical protein